MFSNAVEVARNDPGGEFDCQHLTGVICGREPTMETLGRILAGFGFLSDEAFLASNFSLPIA